MAQASLRKSVVPLRGALDLVSPRFSVTPGTLRACLNYETYSVQGYSRVDGLARYDGAFPCYNLDWVIATRGTGSGTFSIGEYLKVDANYFGIVLAWDSTNLSYLIINPAFAPKVGDTITGNGGATLIAGVGGIRRASQYYADADEFLTAQNTIYLATRTAKKSIYPFDSYAKNVIPHGLHWYKGSLYAIADAYQISFDTGAVEVLPHDEITLTGEREGTVLSVNVVSGSWSDGNAAGTMVVRTDGFLTTNSISIGSKTIRRPNGASAYTSYANAFSITETLVANSPYAQLFQGPLDDDYQTTEQINANASRPSKLWKPVDMGWEIHFKTDDTTTGAAPPVLFRGEFLTDVYTSTANTSAVATSQTLSTGGTLAKPIGTGSDTSPASTPISTVLGDASDSTQLRVTTNAIATIDYLPATLTTFDFSSIPANALVTGIEVSVRGSTTTMVAMEIDFSLVGDAVIQTATKSVLFPENTATTTVTLGGDGDLWNLGLDSAAVLAAIQDASFGLNFKVTTAATSALTNIARMMEMSIKVYYKQALTDFYAHDPITGQDLKISIPYYRLMKGQFNPGATTANWGQGTMSIYNITPTDGATPSDRWTIDTGWELRTDVAGGGNLVAIFSSQMYAALLPARATMERVRKRFEIINANYYANADWVAMYGVDGVGPSWQYDGTYFYNVYTELPVTEDTPSHICYHRNYAVLGYENGQCIVSFPGQPTNFSSVAGATLYPFGERITGLLSLNGTALGVFCESSIHALAGDILAAVDENNAVSQVISPYSGAIEYCIVDAGTPLFADFRGISTIDATNKYGDFENGRVSFRVTPLLVNRVNNRFAYQATQQNLLLALPVRNKNQCRFYGADGLIVTCSLPTDDRGFEFTTQRYSSSADSDTMVPVAMCTGTSRSGRDLIFGTFKLLADDETNIVTPSNPEREMFVYAVDQGNRFDLAPIKHFAQLNYINIDDPNTVDTVRALRLELLTNHYYNGYVSCAVDYQPSTNVKFPLTISPVGQTVRIDKDSDYVVAFTEMVGTTTAIEFGGEHFYPGHVLQAMMTYSSEGRDQLGNSPNQTI